MNFETATPRIASYVMLRKGNKVAFVLRSNTTWMNGYYGLLAGKVEKGECYTDAAIREAKEEGGVDLTAEQLAPLLVCHRHEGKDDADGWVDVIFEATEWSGEVVNAEPHMHSEVAWLDLYNLPENIIPSLKFMLDQIRAGKHYCEYGWGIEKTD